MENTVLNWRNYLKTAEHNLELIRGDIWDFEIFRDETFSESSKGLPMGVYQINLDILKARIKTLNLGSESEPTLTNKTIRGHEVGSHQGRGSNPGDIQFDFVDREDQEVTFFINSCKNTAGRSQNGLSLHKTQTAFYIMVHIYNTSLQIIRSYRYYAALYSRSSLPDQIGDAGTDMSEVSLTLHYAHREKSYNGQDVWY